MIKNSIRQLFRTKVKTFLFFLLITLCALLICLGSNLVWQCQKNMKHFKDVFITIGTVEQKPVTVKRQPAYDAAKKDYVYYNQKKYGKVFSLSELNMEGINYISRPEWRPFYHVYLPDYKIIDDNAGWGHSCIVEASPVEDCVPNGPVKMNIKKVVFSVYNQNSPTFYFCDHYNPHPKKMFKDKTYILCLQESVPHGYEMGNPDNNPYESIPVVGPYSEQATTDGTLFSSSLTGDSIEEMNDDFYNKGNDRYWKAYAKEYEMLFNMVPVTPTEDLNLIMAFYNNDAAITEGRTFKKEDYFNGNAVCIISSKFARRNKINIGDKIPISLHSADYSQPPSINWNICPLSADGNNFEEFYHSDYTVVGIYNMFPGGETDRGYSLANNEIFIPQSSIKADNSNNIGVYGNYVSPYNTSFRIPNGTIDEFMKKWEATGIDNVKIHFYDKGYSKLEEGIMQMERMANILLAAGVFMAVLVLVFFSHMMIGGQKKRTAIERSLGVGKWMCLVSLLTGILLVSAAGCIIGCISGASLTEFTAEQMDEQKMFDTEYSAAVVSDNDTGDNSAEDNTTIDKHIKSEPVIVILVFVSLFGFTVLVSGISAWRNLKAEPLVLLSEKK